MKQTLLVTNQLDTGSAFGLTDTMENVFIPSKVTANRPVRMGEKVQAIVVPNMTRPDRTPWLAVTIIDDTPIEPPQPQARKDALAEFILDNLEQGRATVEEVASDLNMTDESVEAKLAELVAAGRVVRLVCYDLPEEDE